MAEGVLMPKAGITVEECVITEWLKKVGDHVEEGEILFTYETDKATFECESTANGELLEIFYEEGDEVPVLVNVCAVGQKGEDTSALKDVVPKETKAEPGNGKEERAEKEEEAPGGMTQTASPRKDSGEHVSPRARMTAAALGIDPADAEASGPNGRIIERDVRAFAASMPLGQEEKAAACTLEKKTAAEAEYEDVKFSGVRKATAKAMTRSLSTMAQLTMKRSFDATEIMKLRKQIKANGEAMGLPNITINDMVMFAVAKVLRNHKDLNAVIQEENVLRRYTNVHMGMAVDTERGLMVPTIRDADQMTLSELSQEAKELAQTCKIGMAGPDLLSGASFTVSNVGSLGIETFTPVVNPPQVAILGVCGVQTAVKETDGELKAYPKMGLCLTFDHRAIDGTPAGKFLKELCMALENFNLLTMK